MVLRSPAMHPIRHISVSIHCSLKRVYAFASNPMNLPQWASGLSGTTVHKSGDDWISDSPMGRVKIQFAPKNEFGVLDHDVTLPSGEVNHNPFRVLPNQDGSEVVFTLYRLPRMTNDEFEKDAAQILADLKTLKKVLEA